MTYGLYTPDLKASSLQDVDLEIALRYRHGDYVICEERDKTFGFEITIRFQDYWSFRIRPMFQYADLGFVSIKWNRLKCKKPVRIIEEGVKG